MNHQVVSADFDPDVFASGWYENINDLDVLVLDANKSLPFKPNSFSMVVIVDFYSEILLQNISEVLCKGGLLLYESYRGHGGNWIELPRKHFVKDLLKDKFTFEIYKESDVGPNKENVTLRMIARKII